MNLKMVARNCLIAIIMIIISSFFNPFTGYLHDISILRGFGIMSLLTSLILPIFFMSLVNLILNKSSISVAGVFAVLVSLILIVISYKFLPKYDLANNSIFVLYFMAVLFIALTRAANINGGYREIVAGAILGFISGVILLLIFSFLFLALASLFINIAEPIGFFGEVIMFSFTTIPFGFIFWFFISLGEQIYLKKQKVV